VLNAPTCAGCGFEASNPGGPETPAGPDDYIDDLFAAQRA
jgi:hypothetical protein